MTDIENALEKRWRSLLKRIDEDMQTKWWNVIKSKYSEPGRKYHTLSHLNKMFQYLDSHINDVQSPNALSYAIYFHDIEYDVKSQTNEEDSVKLFEQFCKESELEDDIELISQVKDLILQSKTHCTDEHTTEGAYGKDDRHYFLDFDVSILGSDPNEYKEYAAQIQEEYSYLGPAKYNFLRMKVLKSFLMIPNIFATKAFRDKYEEQARANIQDEISSLNKGL